MLERRYVIKDFRERIIKAREDDSEAVKIIKEFEPLIKKCIRMYIRDLSSCEDGLQKKEACQDDLLEAVKARLKNEHSWRVPDQYCPLQLDISKMGLLNTQIV